MNERRIIMSNFVSVIVSYTLAALAGVCFVGGVALLSDGRRA
jgi:hypothetical protein